MAVDLTKIAQFAVVDVHGEWGYAPWNQLSGIRIDPGTGTGTFTGAGGKLYRLAAADPAAGAPSDAPYAPDVTTTTPDAPPSPDAA